MNLLDLEAPATDRDLLDRYVQERDESAFAELVERHDGHVRRVCRGILADEHAVDEITQDTFLLLARKANVIFWQHSVTNWLGAVAYRLAHKRRCATARRRQLEQASDQDRGEACCPLASLADREMTGALDDELNSLPPRYRRPLVLCYLEGKTNRQAADELGWPAGSMARRLARARQLLQQRLVVRGFVVAGVLGLIAGLLLSLGVFRTGLNVREQMAMYRPTAEGPDFETILAQLAQGNTKASDNVRALTRRTIDLADRLRGHGPAGWDALNQSMRDSAVELASALETQDQRGVVLAALRLRNSCIQCHQAYGQERIPQPAASRERQRPEAELVPRMVHQAPALQRATPAAPERLSEYIAVAEPTRIGETEASAVVSPARLTLAGPFRAHPMAPLRLIMTCAA